MVPFSDANHLDLLSDCTSSAHGEALQAEQLNIRKHNTVLGKRSRDLDQDGLNNTPMDLADLEPKYSHLQEIKDLPSSPLQKRILVQDREFGSSLTTKRSSLRKMGNAPVGDTLSEMINFPPLVPTSGDVAIEGIDAFFAGNTALSPTKTQRMVEQEQLQVAESTRRVPVPTMEFSLPAAPRKRPEHTTKPEFLDKDHESLLHDMKETHLSVHDPLSGTLNQAEKREYNSNDGTLFECLTQPACVDSSTICLEPNGRRIPDEANNSKEEDLKLGSFLEANDVNLPVQKRHLKLEEDCKMSLQAQGKDSIPVAANCTMYS